MTLQEFISKNRLRPVDVVVMRKKFIGMLDHYVIYMGVYDNRHIFIANYTKGVKEIPYHELARFLQRLEPVRIERFQGNEFGRKEAWNRALSKIGEKAYNLLNNNCEHFKNWVHSGTFRSKQADNFEKGFFAVAITSVVIGLVSALSME